MNGTGVWISPSRVVGQAKPGMRDGPKINGLKVKFGPGMRDVSIQS